MPATETIEVSVARLDERFNGFQEMFRGMADDQRRLTESYEELVKSNQRLGLVEADLVRLNESQNKLWAKYEIHERDHSKVTGHALYDIIKLFVAVIVGVMLAKFGIHLP